MTKDADAFTNDFLDFIGFNEFTSKDEESRRVIAGIIANAIIPLILSKTRLIKNSREFSIATTKLEEAAMWLNKYRFNK